MVDGHCWVMVGFVGHGWVMFGVVGYWWVMFGVVGHSEEGAVVAVDC